MEKNVMVFANEIFGNVRMVNIDGKPYAVANDVAKALGYKRPADAITAHTKGSVNYRVLTNGGEQTIKIIPQGDIIRLTIKCPLEGADKFESWIFDEVIPSVLNNGGYISDTATDEQVQKLVENYSMRSITKQIHSCPIMQLEKLVEDIVNANTSTGKRDRADKQLQKMDKTEYKNHLRAHLRKAIETKPYSNDIKDHALEIVIRDRLIISLMDDVLETTNRSNGKIVNHLKKSRIQMGLNAVELINALQDKMINTREN